MDISSLGMPADDFCRRMLQEACVLAFPGTLFGDDIKRFIRVGVLTPTERIATGIERMRAFVAKVRSTLPLPPTLAGKGTGG